MFVSVSLEFKKRRLSDSQTKADFWNYIGGLRRSEVEGPDIFPEGAGDISAEGSEFRFRAFFPIELEKRIQNELYNAKNAGRLRKTFDSSLIKVRVVTIEYGSIKSVLEITGIEGKDLQDFVIFVLSTYSGEAFREIFDVDVSFDTSVKVLNEGLNTEGKVASSPRRGLETLAKAWVISNTSLLVPVSMAAYVCYVVYGSLQTERSQILKAVFEQNAKVVELISSHSGSTEANNKIIAELLSAQLKVNLDESKKSVQNSTVKSQP